MRGKAIFQEAERQGRMDHPRTCGEKAYISETAEVKSGSPPHMRGKGKREIGCNSSLRITPAHAGKSLSFAIIPTPFWDHPRTCGEKVPPYKPAKHTPGSPPHMRGKGINSDATRRSCRITPAHAGKSLSDLSYYDNGDGSPPHMRGKVELQALKLFVLRITPAHAGKR